MEKEKNKNFTKLTQKKGISLIVLIVTIIVIIILAAAVILTIGKNNPVDSAKEATFKEDVRSFQDDLSLTISKEYTDKQGQRDEKITTSDYNIIKEKIPSFTEKYKDKFVIENDQLVGTDKLTDKEKLWANDLNVATSGKLPFDAEEWDKTATAETCFQWGSDTEGEEGYNTIIGYNSDLQNYPKVRIPSRCHIIKTSSQVSLDEDVGRSFLKNIQEIEIPNTVIEIGWYAFGSVRGNALNLVTDIVIPNSVTSIGYSAFEGCSSLTNINYTGTMAEWNNISKDSTWNVASAITTITCTDGTITL